MHKPLFQDDVHDHDLTGSKGAIFSACRRYRYLLYRRWQPPVAGKVHTIAFIGLNPSTADAKKEDPTVSRCVNAAHKWGYHQFFMLNLYGFRATDPDAMIKQDDPVGQHNIAYIEAFTSAASDTICCWGVNVLRLNRSHIINAWRVISKPCWCLGLTKNGEPKHPLYLKVDTPFISFKKLSQRYE